MIHTTQEKIDDAYYLKGGNDQMTKRQKQEFNPTLKAEDYDSGKIAIENGTIDAVRERHTKFNEEGENSVVVSIKDASDGVIKDIFANQLSVNNMVSSFGEEDGNWTGKPVRVVCNRENYMNKKQLLIESRK